MFNVTDNNRHTTSSLLKSQTKLFVFCFFSHLPIFEALQKPCKTVDITELPIRQLLYYSYELFYDNNETGLRLRGYGEFWQDSLELLAAGFLTPLHHLVEERRVGLGHDDSDHWGGSGQLSQRQTGLEQ